MDLPLLLLGYAQRQRGFLTRAQALDVGLSRREIDRLVGKNLLRRIWRGLLSLNPAPPSVAARTLERARGIAIAYDEHLVISHVSAVLAHGLPTYRCDLAQSTLVRTNKGDPVSSGSVRIARAHTPLPQLDVDGAPVVQEAVAIAQVACAVGVEAGVVAADAALHRASVTLEELRDAVKLFRGCRGHHKAAAVLRRVDAHAESPGESLVRIVAADAGIDLRPQVEIRDDRGAFVARVDFLVAGTRRIVEFDGKMKYGSIDDLFAEKRREDRLRSLGYDVVRLVWADLDDPGAMAQRIGGGQ